MSLTQRLLRPCLTGVFLLSLAGLRGWALSTAEAALGARRVGGMETKQIVAKRKLSGLK